jgi:hypothetical protein
MIGEMNNFIYAGFFIMQMIKFNILELNLLNFLTHRETHMMISKEFNLDYKDNLKILKLN